MRLDAAYPEGAGLRSLRREFALVRRPQPRVSVRDTYELSKEPTDILVPLYAALEAKVVSPGRISIACAPRKLLLEYDAGKLEARIDAIPVEDASLRDDWGPTLWRIHLVVVRPGSSGSYELSFRPEG
jgi:hypothetical protein